MGVSRASKNLLHRVSRRLKGNKQLQDLAAKRMDKKYPGGWSQTPTKMAEFKKMKKDIYKGIGK